MSNYANKSSWGLTEGVELHKLNCALNF